VLCHIHIVKKTPKINQNWTPFFFACWSIFQVLKVTYKHHNNIIFFPFGKNSFKLVPCINLVHGYYVFIFLSLMKAIIFPCSQFSSCHGFLVWISNDAFKHTSITFFLFLHLFHVKHPSSIMQTLIYISIWIALLLKVDFIEIKFLSNFYQNTLFLVDLGQLDDVESLTKSNYINHHHTKLPINYLCIKWPNSNSINDKGLMCAQLIQNLG
jgi:hypothetical protein